VFCADVKTYLEHEYRAELKTLVDLQHYRNQFKQLTKHWEHLHKSGKQKLQFWEAEQKRREKQYQDDKQHQARLYEKLQSLQTKWKKSNKECQKIEEELKEMESGLFTKTWVWIKTVWRNWLGRLGAKAEKEAKLTKHRSERDKSSGTDSNNPTRCHSGEKESKTAPLCDKKKQNGC
jgi:predicted nuclease with TOPRIM domain